MADWISSKLKVAESFLQQIDQQAAESLGKNDKPASDELNYDNPKKASEVLPLRDQLKKKTPETNDFLGKLHSDHNLNVVKNKNRDREKEVATSGRWKASSKPNSSLNDSDWTDLLSGSSQPTPSAANHGNGVSGIRSLRKDGRRLGTSVSDWSAKRNLKTQNSVKRASSKPDIALENKVNGDGIGGRRSDGDPTFSDSMLGTSSVEFKRHGESSEEKEPDCKDGSLSVGVEHKNKPNEERNCAVDTLGEEGSLHLMDGSTDAVPLSTGKQKPLEMVLATVDGGSDMKVGLHDGLDKYTNVTAVNEFGEGPNTSASQRRGSPLASDGNFGSGSDSDSESASTSDSESEHERLEKKRRREQILAEQAAAKAAEAVKERENMVARLEGEKQSLEKILEERAKQQAQEASELQTTMMQMMEAVDLEKQKHNNTRMEALTRLAKLETMNADLARSLATAQWNLEVEVNQVSELRQQIELKEATHEELRRKISNTHQTSNKLVTSSGVEFEHEIHEAELSFMTDKVGRLQKKAKALETNIEMTRKEIEDPTEVEIELKQRLGPLTDHLIQKQAQVEALSSERATLLFRIEVVSRFLDENAANFPSTSSGDDLESGMWGLSDSKLRPLFEGKIRSGQRHLGSLVRQLDYIFCAGAVFLRRNSTARLWSLVYLICLHFWVVYILMSHSPVSDGAGSGAVISLDKINYTGHV